MKGNLKPSLFIKRYISFIAGPLVHCINISIDRHTFPNILKTSVISPLAKKGNSLDPCNRRPISTLSFFAKLFESHIYVKLEQYLESNNILHRFQFGFRKHNSTSMALTHFQNLVTDALDKNLVPIAVFLDIAKAFDSVDNVILLQKLEHYGIRGNTLLLFQRYLLNRTHRTFCNSVLPVKFKRLQFWSTTGLNSRPYFIFSIHKRYIFCKFNFWIVFIC